MSTLMGAAIFGSGTRLLFVLLKPPYEVPFSSKLYMYAYLLVPDFSERSPRAVIRKMATMSGVHVGPINRPGP